MEKLSTMAKETIHTVDEHGLDIYYTLERKKVKNINLRVRPDGSVYVSAPYRASTAYIDAFVRERADFIRNSKDIFAKRQAAQEHLQGRDYNYGDIIYILGKPAAVALSPSKRNGYWFDGEILNLELTDVEDIALRQRMVHRFYDELAEELFQEVLREEYELVRPYGVPFPVLRMRTMKTRWGTCNFVKGIITMNKRLIHVPLPCVEKVMLHELCHFLVGNHSPSFYAWLDKLMPDWRERKEVLDTWAMKTYVDR
ncbi:MAG: M48 family metallopeptidase [Phascolarctobacterium sp.]